MSKEKFQRILGYLEKPLEERGLNVLRKKSKFLRCRFRNRMHGKITKRKGLRAREIKSDQRLVFMDKVVGIKGFFIELCKVRAVKQHYVNNESLLTKQPQIKKPL